MNHLRYKYFAAFLSILFCSMFLLPPSANAQKRDYLTDEEIELVRDAQEIDLRVAVLTKAIDRRFLVINNDVSQSKRVEKDSDKWGELPKGTRGALIWDIERILQKAIDDIDDVAAHTKMDEKIFPKAVFALTESCQSYLPKFKMMIDATNDEKEKGSLLGAIENCNQVIEASVKVPKIIPKDKKKDKEKKSKADS